MQRASAEPRRVSGLEELSRQSVGPMLPASTCAEQQAVVPRELLTERLAGDSGSSEQRRRGKERRVGDKTERVMGPHLRPQLVVREDCFRSKRRMKDAPLGGAR